MGRWAVRVRRYVDQPRLKIIETRSLQECSEQLSGYCWPIIGLELTETSLDRSIPWWLELSRTFPRAMVLALCDRLPRSTEHLCRELGAIDILQSELDAVRLGGLVDRYLSEPHFEILREESPDLQVRLRSRLPWSRKPS
jgi:hypothetical protein